MNPRRAGLLERNRLYFQPMGRWVALLAFLVSVPSCSSGERSAGGELRSLPELELWGHLRHDPSGLATAATPGPLGFDAIGQSAPRPHALIHVSGFT